ncbi:GAF domain-containing protein [Nocardioides sp.]|uniref:helix-turn-helix domain-containing protein n=1 Tax=Nocardioides sp. TaxID=35761 RepID=UPI0035280D14
MATDARDRARARERALDDLAAGAPTGGAVAVRPEIQASWRRVQGNGLGPGDNPAIPPLAEAELEGRRAVSPLADLLPHLRAALQPVVDVGLLVVVTDTEGRVLWRTGEDKVTRQADRLGFVGGSAWTEYNVGTNAIGTSLVLGRPVLIRGSEHYVESHTVWSCAAAPLHDAWTGETLGVVDVSGVAAGMHPTVLSMVTLAARTAELEIQAAHHERLARLRAHAAPLLAAQTGQAVAVDLFGHLAAARGFASPARVVLPADLAGGPVHLPSLGPAYAEPLPGGWLLRLLDEEADDDPLEVCLDLSGARPVARLLTPAGPWEHALSTRHAEILLALLQSPGGRSAAELADDLFADPSRTVTVRAEVSRLRRTLGPVVSGHPYRLLDGVTGRLIPPAAGAEALPGSAAPVVAAFRRTSA